MSSPNESKLPAILFLLTVYGLSELPPFSPWAIGYGLVLMAIGAASIMLLGRAVFRLGLRGWYLLLQLGVWFGLFIALAPISGGYRVLAVWGVGLPLMMCGMGCRYLIDRFPTLGKVFDDALRGAALCAFVLLAVSIYVLSSNVLTAIFGALAICVLASIPLYFGWQLGKQPPRGPHDARFGSSDDFRKAGMSDER